MPRWQSNFNKNSVTAKLVIEIAVAHRRYPNAKTEHSKPLYHLSYFKITYDPQIQRVLPST